MFLSMMIRPKKQAPVKHIQYAALPFRKNNGSLTEILLITSRHTGRWIIPKGWPLKGKAPHKAAEREALEEAGLVGKIDRRPIGSFSYKKRLKRGEIVVCEVRVFVLKVKRQKASWPEKGERQLKWLSQTMAAATVGDPELGIIIRTLPAPFPAQLADNTITDPRTPRIKVVRT
jgi:8-oxo-dGTP pyrophosphatase MutT (NUDIX family)